jgi:gliding motility-associated lipoprotein GldH
MRNPFFLSVCSLFLWSACGKTNLCDKKYDFAPSKTWTYQDTLNFGFKIKDTMALYDMVLRVKHRADYSYRNIYTQIYTQFPDNQRIHQTLSLDLSDRTGKSEGKCSGDNCDVEITLQENAFFNQVGSYQITLAQFMRIDSLKSIESIAFRLTDTGNKRDLAAEAAATSKKRKR